MTTGEYKALGGADKNLGYCGVLEASIGCSDVVMKKVRGGSWRHFRSCPVTGV